MQYGNEKDSLCINNQIDAKLCGHIDPVLRGDSNTVKSTLPRSGTNRKLEKIMMEINYKNHVIENISGRLL